MRQRNHKCGNPRLYSSGKQGGNFSCRPPHRGIFPQPFHHRAGDSFHSARGQDSKTSVMSMEVFDGTSILNESPTVEKAADVPDVQIKEEHEDVEVVMSEVFIKDEPDEEETPSDEHIEGKNARPDCSDIPPSAQINEDTIEPPKTFQVGQLKIKSLAQLIDSSHSKTSVPPPNLHNTSVNSERYCPPNDCRTNLSIPQGFNLSNVRAPFVYDNTVVSQFMGQQGLFPFSGATSRELEARMRYIRSLDCSATKLPRNCAPASTFNNGRTPGMNVMSPKGAHPNYILKIPSVQSYRTPSTPYKNIWNPMAPQSLSQAQNYRPRSNVNFVPTTGYVTASYTGNINDSSTAISATGTTTGQTVSEGTELKPLEKTINSLQTSTAPDNSTCLVKTELDLDPPNVDDQMTEDQGHLSNIGTFGMHFLDERSETVDAKPESIIRPDPNPEATKTTTNNTEDPDDELPPHNPNAKYLCKYCDYRCSYKSVLKMHSEKIHSTNSRFACFICRKMIHDSLDHLEHHVATKHRDEKRWQCRTCGKSYKGKQAYKKHAETRCRVNKPYACHQCTYTCNSLYFLAKHRKRHEKMEQFITCPICHKAVKGASYRAHELAHTAEPLKCELCDYTSVYRGVLNKHYSRHHGKRYPCPLCDKGFDNEEGLEIHIASIHPGGKRSYICTFSGCDKRYDNKKMFENHMLLHTLPAEALYHCINEDCDYKCIVKNLLTLHYKKTRHNWPYKCPDCNRRFRLEPYMATHIQRVHVLEIMKKRGDIAVEDNGDEDLDEDNDADMSDTEDDAVANFRRGWLGMSDFIEEQNLEEESRSVPVDGDSNLQLAGKGVDALPDTGNEFTFVVPEISCKVECVEDEVKDASEGMCDSKIDSGIMADPKESRSLAVGYPKISEVEHGGSALAESGNEFTLVIPEMCCKVECVEDEDESKVATEKVCNSKVDSEEVGVTLKSEEDVKMEVTPCVDMLTVTMDDEEV